MVLNGGSIESNESDDQTTDCNPHLLMIERVHYMYRVACILEAVDSLLLWFIKSFFYRAYQQLVE